VPLFFLVPYGRKNLLRLFLVLTEIIVVLIVVAVINDLCGTSELETVSTCCLILAVIIGTHCHEMLTCNTINCKTLAV
jgi:hypothetical protein